MSANPLITFFLAVAMLTGTIVGVGLFALPYLTLQVGWPVMFGYFLVVGGLVAVSHVLFGDLARHTPDHKRLPGFAGYYWGRGGRGLSLITHLGGLMGSILAYVVVGGEFLNELLGTLKLDVGIVVASLIYLLAGAAVIYFDLKAVAKFMAAGLAGFLLILGGLVWLGRREMSWANILARDGAALGWLAPYGAILFSLWGASVVPQVEEMLGRNKKLLSGVIVTSILLSALVYVVFSAAVLGLSGSATTPSALTGLGALVGLGAQAILLLFGLITTFTSLVVLGMTFRQVLQYDLGWPQLGAWLVTWLAPLALFLAGVKNFIELIIFVGAVFVAIDGINIILMYRRGVPAGAAWKRATSVILLPILAGGILYAVADFLRLFR